MAVRQHTSFGVWPLAASALVLLPWLNPFSFGPTSPALQWLVTLTAVAGLLLLGAVWHAAVPQAKAPWARSIAWGWLLAGLVSSVFGLVQYLGASAAWAPWVNVNEVGRAFANLRQPNQFATLTNMALAALCWVVVQAKPGVAAGGWALRWWPAVAALVLAAGNAASSSRTGFLQLLLVLALGWWWGAWRNAAVRRVLLAAAMGYAVALLVLPLLIGLGPLALGALGRFQDDAQPCTSRLVLWRNVLDLIAQRPWLGWGWGGLDYAHYTTLYPGGPDDRFCAILDNAHNLPLQLAVELGLPVALLLCGAFTWWVLRQKPWRESDATRQLGWAVLALIGLHSLLEYPLWYGPFLMAVGLCCVLLWRGAPVTRPAAARWTAAGLVAWGLVVAAATAYAAWDYHRISQLYLAPEARDADYRHDTATKVGGTWLFRDQVRFAYVTTVPVTRANAAAVFPMAEDLLHFSPEPRVIEPLIESASLLGEDAVAAAHIRRYRAAFPQEFAAWSALNKLYADTLAAP